MEKSLGLIGANHGLKDCRNILMSRANQRFGKFSGSGPMPSRSIWWLGAKMRYNLLGQADHWFPGENAQAVDDENFRPFSKKVLSGSEFPKFSAKRTRCFREPQARLSQS